MYPQMCELVGHLGKDQSFGHWIHWNDQNASLEFYVQKKGIHNTINISPWSISKKDKLFEITLIQID